MTEAQRQEIRQRLDQDLSLEAFEQDFRPAEEAATQFFQDLFVQVLNFDETPSPLGDATWQNLPVHEWPDMARTSAARLFAESGNFRVIYVELESLTRTAERNAIRSLTRSERTSGWAVDGSFLALFHTPDEEIWHLVTPYEEGTDDITTGRPVLRRYTLGEGETHRTVADALSSMDATKGRLSERIDEAFRVKPVTEQFYGDYKDAFDTLYDELVASELEIEEAHRYAHLTLNRLMFFYYLQKKGWIAGRKDFVRWFHDQYEASNESDKFHEKWLSTLFFDGMNQPASSAIDADLPKNVESTIADLPEMNGGLFQPTEEDKADIFISDSALDSVIRGFLDQYNFTVTEESPYDIDVAVDPAMLGKIYESLIAEQERGEAGIYYTPRVEVDLMCRMSLYEQFCDYAEELDANGKQRIIEFIFSEPQDWNMENNVETKQLENILHDLRIVDPACGSGAFLVGMKQVLTELYRKLGTTPDYHLKEQIINENIYGVDIKDWAIRVAEFRLWLSLVEGEEQLPNKRPVLPNFSFKIKVGDSLIQKLDGKFISLDTLTRTLDGDTGDHLLELKELKREHFEGEEDNVQEIEQRQVELVRKHIDGLIDNVSNDGSQQTLSGDTKDEQMDKEVEERIEELKKTRDAIDEAGAAGFFMWDIDFSDVMVEGGFDIVIGNPPYVRQEDIIDQGLHPERLEAMDDSEVKELKKEYKDDLVAYVQNNFDLKPYKRSDIYVYFFFKGLDLLREGGTLTYITSNSWLDVNYGQRLQEGILRFGDLKYLLDNRAGPIFDEADVNTVISMMNRTAGQETLSGSVSSITFYDYYEDLVGTDIMGKVFASTDRDKTQINYRNETIQFTPLENGRRVTLNEASLWRLGGGAVKTNSNSSDKEVFSEGEGAGDLQAGLKTYQSDHESPRPSGSYTGEENWSLYIQAPNIYFRILNQNDEKLTTLGEIAHVFRGLRTGKNTYFYPDEKIIDEFDLPGEYLQLVVKSPRGLDQPLITKEDLETKLLLMPEDAREIDRLVRYIDYGEENSVDSSSAANNPWYSLKEIAQEAEVFWQGAHYTEHVVYYSDSPLYLDQRFYGVSPKRGKPINSQLIASILNSTFYALAKTVSGRTSSGRSIDTAESDIRNYPFPDPEKLTESEKEQFISAFGGLATSNTEAIYAEFDKPERKALDKVLFDLLNLEEEERTEIYNQTEQLIREVRERDKQR